MTQKELTIPANNIVRLTKNDIILMVLTGQQTKDTIAELIVDLAVMIDKLHQNNQQALVLADLDHMVHSPHSDEASKEAVKLLALSFDAMAICNSNPNNVSLSEQLVSKISQRDVHSFPTAKEAARWLAAFKVNTP